MNKTAVIFRKWHAGGDIIALFPELPGTADYNTCASYEHIGQHGAAVPPLERLTVPAKPEEYAELARELKGVHNSIFMCDFLTVAAPAEGYDLIIMNPPFHMGADIDHIKHAAGMLAPGGMLVALCMAGPHRERELRPLSATWEPLPAGSFKSEGTGIDAVLLTINAGAAI
jgi:hypothetical protein